jgi:hypothetical protein
MNHTYTKKFKIFGFAVVVLGFTLAGCGGSDGSGPTAQGPFDLSFDGVDYGVHEGQTLYVALVRLTDSAVISRDSAMISGGSFSFTWADVLARGTSYRLDYYADVNFNMECESSDDHVWSTRISSVSDHVAISDTHDANFDFTACDSFPRDDIKYDLTFRGSAFQPHEGQTLFAAVVRIDNGNTVEEGATVVTNGLFELNWMSSLEEGKSFYIDYYADINGDSQCSTSSDHYWRETIQNVMADQVIEVTHGVNFNDSACMRF